MQKILEQILTEISGLKDGQEQLSKEVSSIREEVSSIREEMATKDDIIRLETKFDKIASESQDDVKALLKHINEKTDSLPRIEMKLDILEHRIFEQEVDIKLLKVVK